MDTQSGHIGIVRNQRFHQLSFAEQLTLWSVRMWLRAYCRRSEMFATVHEAFELLGIADAGRAFDDGMAILAIGTHQDLIFLNVDSQYISQDEVDFLEVLAAFQKKDADRARAQLHVWMPVSSCRVACAAFKKFAIQLANCGLLIGTEGDAALVGSKSPNLTIHSKSLH